MSVRVLRSRDYQRMRWKNGGGWTSELARAGDDVAFDWRISIAEIENDGAFSTFPGCDRQIALLAGAGMEIEFEEAETVRLDQRLRFFPFAGEWHARGRLLGGPVRDFNVIARRDTFRAEVLYRPLVGPMVFLPEAATTWFVYLAGGRAALQDVPDTDLEVGDSLLLEPGDAVRNRVLSGGGEVVLVKLIAR
jgi:environmental stress-induced protein Ves